MLAAAACGVLVGALAAPRPSRAENGALPRTCDLEANGGSITVPYTDPAGRFRLAAPCGWRQVTGLLPDSPVLASWYNPEEPGAETLAVYAAPAPEGVERTEGLGSPQDVAAALARIAPNGAPLEWRGRADSSGRAYATAGVQFGGNTAGKFGAAREFRTVVVERGAQYTLRVTTTRYRHLALPQVVRLMAEVADSFELL